jgi:predicted AlkP superfamily phosphohydrolase/phosphomutase
MLSAGSRTVSLKRLLAAMLLTTMLGACSSTPERTPAGHRKARLLVVGMDGLEPRLVRDFLAQGRLPHFRRLIQRGVLADIACRQRMVSPVAWTTVATGVPPDEHGITYFTTKEGVLFNSTMRRRPAFWNILARSQVHAATIGWFVTWPAEKDAGIIVSDRTHGVPQDSKVSPPGVIDPRAYEIKYGPPYPFLGQFTPARFDPSYTSLSRDDPKFAVNFLLEERLANTYLRDHTYAAIAREVTAKNDLDALFVYFQGSDFVGHGFWKYFEPAPFRVQGIAVDEAEVALLKDVIPRYYDYLDSLLGELLAEVDPDALVMVLSDHGFGPALGEYKTEPGDFLSGNHRFTAVLVLSGPQIRAGAKQARDITHYDILPTILYALKLPIARDEPGTPLIGFFTDESRPDRRPLFVDTYRTLVGQAPPAPRVGKDEERILEQLRSLGYIK